MESVSRRVLLLYGSQTGMAEDLSEELYILLKNRHFQVEVCSMDAYPIQNLINENISIFICSTTGQGEEPDNMKSAWKFLLRCDLPPNSLENTLFTVLGLGDSSYQKFNFVAKRLEKRLKQLGATPLYPLTLADEQHELGLDAVTLPWLSDISTKLLSMCPIPNGLEAILDTSLPPPKFNISIQPDKMSSTSNHKITAQYSEISPYLSKLVSNERLTSKDHFQDTRHVIVDVNGSDIKYYPGDVAMIQPLNSAAVVKEFIKILNLEPRTILSILPNENKRNLPANISHECTVSDFALNLDLTCRPRRSFFSLLSKLSRDELERERLTEFSSSQGQDDLFDYCYRPRKMLLEVLQDFPKTASDIPLTYLLDLIPTIKPRPFSIASSPSVHPNQIHLLVARVEYRTKLPNSRLGLCSNWLSNLNTGDTIPIWVKKGTFNLTKFPLDPYIMIGPGTGVAPFRSIICQRAFEGIQNNYLFFGCRYKSKDFYFEHEWETYESVNSLKLFTAFSRDTSNKNYVQHRIAVEKPLIKQLLMENCVILIAGNAKDMPNNVMEVLRGIIMESKGITEVEAGDSLQHMIRQGRVQLETWS